MVGQAWSLYSKWRTHPEWERLRLREDAGQVKRKDGKIEKVADGVLFPILCALSRFVTFSGGQWSYRPPHVFREADIAYAARRQLTAHGAKPMHMGRSGSAYAALFLVTEMAQRFEAQTERAEQVRSKPETVEVPDQAAVAMAARIVPGSTTSLWRLRTAVERRA